jgi:uncharacterized membrane protein YccC
VTGTAGRDGPAARTDLRPERVRDSLGLHYAARILVASSLLWFTLTVVAEQNPIWAISSMVAVMEPNLQVARRNFWARVANTLIGGAMGLAFVFAAGPRAWVLPLAMAATVLVTSYVVRVQTYWKIAPITAALVMASSLEYHSRRGGELAGLRRLGEVILGSAMALVVAFAFSRLWPPPVRADEAVPGDARPRG